MDSEEFVYEKLIELKPLEKQNPNKMLDDNLKSLQAERLERGKRQANAVSTNEC